MTCARILATLVIILALTSGHAQAASKAQQGSADNKAPLKITSNEMITDKKNRKIIFSGSVVAVKGKLTIKTDEMTVWTDEEQREFKRIVARGSVKIVRDNKTATGDTAEYFNVNPKTGEQERIEITGDAFLQDERTTASGKKVVYYFQTEDMKIYGGAEKRSVITIFGEDAAPPEQPMERERAASPERPPVAEKHAPQHSAISGPVYVVQAASFPNMEDASEMAEKLTSRGFTVFVEKAQLKTGTWYRVKVGRYQSPEEAETAASRIRSEMGLKPIIIQKNE
ncbi:MAG: SPOR domain-containing protein [Nitrospinota bacterium]|nr:SPOR domain-containing protein [Nitrospinota bacterium]